MGDKLTYDSQVQRGEYSFSLTNKLTEPVKDVYCMVVFYDSSGSALDFDLVKYPGVIPLVWLKGSRGRWMIQLSS